MKKTIFVLLGILFVWIPVAWGQYDPDPGERSEQRMIDRWEQQDEMRQQQYEIDQQRLEQRQMHDEQQELQWQQQDIERQQREQNWNR